MGHRRVNGGGGAEREVRHFSTTWETAGTLDLGCLVDVLEMVADENGVEFAPVGYLEGEGRIVIRVDGQLCRGADADELEGFAASLGRAVAAEATLRPVLPDMTHPDDVATAKFIRRRCDRDHLSAGDSVPLAETPA